MKILSFLKKKRSPNVSVEAVFFGSVLLGGSLYKLYELIDFSAYVFLFQHLSWQGIVSQYSGSVLLRGFVLVTAIGLLRHKEFYRRLAVGLGFFTLVTLYWKYPYEVFYHVAVATEQVYSGVYPIVNGNEVLKYPIFPVISRIFFMAIDGIFNLVMIWALTRPTVRQKFQ